MSSMSSIAVYSPKGGVGKSTCGAFAPRRPAARAFADLWADVEQRLAAIERAPADH